ncbi:hybrid sensor histidine kinase/response regulator [Polaribacter litorisediminis]|uniref:hybrid sensor histidine kinase/response regulator n=1 Tax=Polaribacter litorisediminis TaxID=1908341 RepID=UPI001CBB7F2C|nr:hybrid sensor histidine kinase/response regulator [Polaribacter litorisediminis]UAM98738.1 hybrid sensor histidine kinase/response regulator [Polaribacter litorisediminis]
MSHKNRLLIIDDEEIVRDSIREILSPQKEELFSVELGEASADLFGETQEVVERNPSSLRSEFYITEAKNGEEGLQKVKESLEQGAPFNVIFIDMRMPGWDGLTTCVEIRKLDSKAQIHFITAYTDRSIDEIISKAGGDVGYLSKPFIPEEIIQLASKSLHDWARLNSLEKLLKIIGEIGLGTTQLKTLLTNILHQIADYIGADYAVLGKLNKDVFEEISAMGVGKHSIRIDLLSEKVDLKSINDITYTEGVLICPLEQYFILTVPSKPELFNQEKVYLLRLFVENAVRAIHNSELSEELLKREKLSAVGQAISMVMHDIRNPIGSLTGIAHLIKRDPGNKDQNEQLADFITVSTKNALNIISDVLDFTKNASIQKDHVNLNEWLKLSVAQVVMPEGFEAENIIISGIENAAIAIDVKKMDRVLINLVNNAIEALIESKTASPEVHIICEENSEKLILKIKDNGPGIPEEIKAKLFDAFVTKNKANGTGLGLAIVKQIIDAHKGYIKVNEPEIGSEFEIGLPK